MKKFHFQLDTVLGYKQQVLDNRLVEHGAAVAQVTRQEAVLLDAQNRRGAYEAEFRQKQAEGMTMFEALKYQSCMEALMREIEREKEKLPPFDICLVLILAQERPKNYPKNQIFATLRGKAPEGNSRYRG